MKKALVAVLIICSTIAFGQTDSDVDKAWRALEGAGQQSAEQLFKASINQNKNNTRAYLGLSLLYELQDRKPEAWDAFINILKTNHDYYPC